MNQHIFQDSNQPAGARTKTFLLPILSLLLCLACFSACSGKEDYLTLDDLAAYNGSEKVLDIKDTGDNSINFESWEYYELSKKPFETRRGVKIGDPADKLIKKYGNLLAMIDDDDQENDWVTGFFNLKAFSKVYKLPRNGSVYFLTAYGDGKPGRNKKETSIIYEDKNTLSMELYTAYFTIENGYIDSISLKYELKS